MCFGCALHCTMLPALPLLQIDLEWPVASRYVVRDIELDGDHPASHRAAIRIAQDATIALRRPLEENASLFAEFANLDGSQNACLNFAHQYGTLFPPWDAKTRFTSNRPDLESFVNWRSEIKKIRDIVKRCELTRSNPAEAFRQFGKKDKWLVGVELVLSITNPHSPATLETRVQTLIAGMQLQAVQSTPTRHGWANSRSQHCDWPRARCISYIACSVPAWARRCVRASWHVARSRIWR